MSELYPAIQPTCCGLAEAWGPLCLLLWGLWWHYDNEQSSLAILLPNVIHFSFSLEQQQQQCETKPVSQSYESQSIVADGWKLMLVCFVLVHAWEFIISGFQLKIEKLDILQWGPIKLDTGSSLANLPLIFTTHLSRLYLHLRTETDAGQIERNFSNYCLLRLETFDNTTTTTITTTKFSKLGSIQPVKVERFS